MHTHLMLKNCLINLNDQFQKKISIVFGCGGNRDKFKRKLMGKLADLYCHKIYLTDDNPRNENPKSIRNEIKKGINLKKKIYEISDRKKQFIKLYQILKVEKFYWLQEKVMKKYKFIKIK